MDWTDPPSILLATRNPAKAERLRWLFDGLDVRFRKPGQLPVPPMVPEEGKSHRENAVAKALAWSGAAGGLAVASDGGLVVPALGNSWDSLATRRATGGDASDAEHAAHLLELMRPYQRAQRKVWWVEAVALARDGALVDAWEAQGLTGVLASAYDPPPNSTSGFWLPGLWRSAASGKRYWQLSEQELLEADDPWLQLRPPLQRSIVSNLGNPSGERFPDPPNT